MKLKQAGNIMPQYVVQDIPSCLGKLSLLALSLVCGFLFPSAWVPANMSLLVSPSSHQQHCTTLCNITVHPVQCPQDSTCCTTFFIIFKTTSIYLSWMHVVWQCDKLCLSHRTLGGWCHPQMFSFHHKWTLSYWNISLLAMSSILFHCHVLWCFLFYM